MKPLEAKFLKVSVEGHGSFVTGSHDPIHQQEVVDVSMGAADAFDSRVTVESLEDGVVADIHPARREKRVHGNVGLFEGQEGADRWATIFKANPTGRFQRPE